MADSVSEVFAQMADRFDPSAWGAGDAVLQFNITGDGGGQWIATIKNNELSITPGSADSPAMTLTCSDADMIAMVNGELSPVSAFMAGRVKIDGNMSLAMKLQSLLT